MLTETVVYLAGVTRAYTIESSNKLGLVDIYENKTKKYIASYVVKPT